MWSKTEDTARCIKAIQYLFELNPLEMTQWFMKDKLEDNGAIVEAYYINQHTAKAFYAVPKKKKTEKDLLKEIFNKGIDDIKKDSGVKKGLPLKMVHFDFEESTRQTILEGGTEVEILYTEQKNDGSYQYGILAVPLPVPPNDGSLMYDYILMKFSWQFIAYDELILKPRNRGLYSKKKSAPEKGQAGPETKTADENNVRKKEILEPNFYFMPIYLWYGTGLKDREDYCTYNSISSTGVGFFDELINNSLNDELALERRRNTNLERQKRLLQKDIKRRREALKRKEVLGDMLLSPAELDDMTMEVDVDNDDISWRVMWDSRRIWEEAVDEVLEELPVGGFGLAMFAYVQDSENACLELFRRCAWKLRGRISEENLSREAQQRALLPLVKVAKIWLKEDEINDVLRQVKLYP